MNSSLEKYLPILLSLLLPGISFLNNPSDEWRLDLGVHLYLGSSLVLYTLWNINRFLNRRKFLSAWKKRIAKLLVNVGYIGLITFLFDLIFSDWTHPYADKGVFFLFMRLSVAAIIFNLIQTVLSTIRQQERLKVQNITLQAENLKSQLGGMKQQIDPHFLFNSLNTLVDLIEEDRERAVTFTRSFSQLYRRVLQSRQHDFITLEDELEFLKDYWNLLHMRFGEALVLEVDVDPQCMNRLIPPLSLQFLIENAVKHNRISARSPLRIEIRNEKEVLVVQNELRPKAYQAPGEGLGLQNLQKRFSLLHKPIVYGQQADCFTVRLPLKPV